MSGHIVDQDRENIFKIEDGVIFSSEVNVQDGTFYGINLKLDGKPLGTFDSVLEIMEEITRIFEAQEEVYLVSGYSDYSII